jgi:hypothetical protein
MHSRCFGIMGGHGNFAFNLVVKLEVINSINVQCIVVSFTILRLKNTQTSREIQQHGIFILVGPNVRHFSDGSQTLCPTLQK